MFFVVVDKELCVCMGKVVVEVGKVVNYCGVGMVEFLFDKNGEFYFFEMNMCL